MLKYVFVFFTLFIPVKASALQTFNRSHSSGSWITCMAPPPGNFISNEAGRRITNKVNPPGCTVETTRRNRPNGTTEIRETLTCTSVHSENASGRKTKTRPSSSSKLNKKDEQTVKDFMARRGSGSGSSNKRRN